MNSELTMVGRDRELKALLRSLFETVSSRSARVVFVSGEAGIGKSSLLDAFAAEALSAHTRTDLLLGRGQALMNTSSTDSYQAIREGLRGLSLSADRRGPTVLRRVGRAFATHAPDWAESVPLFGGLVSASLRTAQTIVSSEARPTDAGLSEQFADLVRTLCRDQPVVLILDDLHWADIDTINALSMIERTVDGPLLLVLAFRQYGWEGAANSQPLRKMIDRINRYRRPQPLALHLTPLDQSDTRAIALRSGSSEIDSEDLDRIVTYSGGNPLFIGELLRNISRKSALPSSISGILRERVGTLTREDLWILEKAAVVGFRFEIDHLAVLCRIAEHELYDRLDALLAEEMVVPLEPLNGHERYEFRHPLIGELFTERVAQNPPRHRYLHSRLLEALEAARPWDDAMSIRAAATADRAGQPTEAALYGLEAASRQQSLGAFGKALELGEAAVRRAREAGLTATTASALVLLAECLTAMGAHAAAADRCREALELVPPEELGDVLFLRARNLRMQQNWEPATQALDSLFAQDLSDELMARSKLLLAEILLTGPGQDLDRVFTLCSEAENLTGNPQVHLRAVGHRGLAHLAAGSALPAEEVLQQALELALSLNDPYAEYEATHWLAKKHLAALELAQATLLLARLEQLTERYGIYRANPRHLRDQARVMALSADVAQAAVLISEFVRLAFDGLPGRTLASVVCLVHELDGIAGKEAGDKMIDALHAEARRLDDSSLSHLFELLRMRRLDWDPAELAARSDLVTDDDARSAVATFHFYMAHFSDFRVRPPRTVGTGV
jgi:tetratricopeptide (TPR) repeat protein